jgi:hypothetical protein
MATVPAAAATTVSPRSALAESPRLKSISYDWCALLLLELPVQLCPQGKGSWKFVARICACSDPTSGSAEAADAVPRLTNRAMPATIAPLNLMG